MKKTTIHKESGNVIFFILLGVVLLGLVTAAIRNSGIQGANIDEETLVLQASRVRSYATELERGVAFILRNSISEVDIRFANGDAPSDYGNISDGLERQVFHRTGGAAEYRRVPDGINDGSPWEFYGNSHLPLVGTDKADLIAVLPNVSLAFCNKINEINGYNGQPLDPGGGATDCLYSGDTVRFSSSDLFDATPNTTDEGTFSIQPSMQGCVQCASGNYHFYHVLLAR
jgi:hypothetical protein